MNEPSGYIKLHRRITENELWHSERFTKSQAWVDLLLLATYKPRTVFIRGIEINLKPGQLCYSQLTLAERWKWNFKTVVSYLKALEKRGMLETKTNNITTVITIKNWDLYQGAGEQNGDQTGEQMESRTETNKKVKKVKKVENQYSIVNIPINLNGDLFLRTKFFFVTNYLKDELKNSLSLRISDEEMKYQFLLMDTWMESNGPRKNYKLFFMNWFKKVNDKSENKKLEQVFNL